MILKYQSSNGQVFDLKEAKIKTRTADFHDYTWVPQTVERQYGTAVSGFRKDAKTYTIVATALGTLEQKRNNLNLLHEAFDHDIRNLTPGRIVHGAFYIDCYMTQVSTTYEEPWTQNQFVAYCPNPFWARDEVLRLEPQVIEDPGGIDLPYDLPYDLGRVQIGYGMIENLASGASDMTLRFYGSCSNPFIRIDGHMYGVNVVLGEGEYVEINTALKTVTAHYQSGEANVFNLRTKRESVFDRIRPGNHEVEWSGSFPVEVVIHEERSEPLWI